MAKPNFVRNRAKQEGVNEYELIDGLLILHNHNTPALADDIGISHEGMWMWLTSHGYERQWVRTSQSNTDFDKSHNDVVTEKAS